MINVRCGCFIGDINKFEKVIEDLHKDTIYEKQYKMAIGLAKISITREINI